jgi:hypothetical protein
LANFQLRKNIGIGLVANMSIQIYRYWQKYQPETYVGIGWTHTGRALFTVAVKSM